MCNDSNGKRNEIHCHEVGSDFYELVEKAKQNTMKRYGYKYSEISVLDKVTSVITLQQVIDAARLDLKDYIIKTKMADEIEEINSTTV